MSMYNLMHGMNEMTPFLLSVLDLTSEQCGRFRDIHLNGDGTRIIVTTRNGGGNREHWDTVYEGHEAGETCPCPGCIIGDVLPKHPNYVRDWDDDFDCTYAYVEFNVPEEYVEICKGMATGEDPVSVGDMCKATVAEMKNMSPEELHEDPRFKPLIKMLDKVVENLK